MSLVEKAMRGFPALELSAMSTTYAARDAGMK